MSAHVPEQNQEQTLEYAKACMTFSPLIVRKDEARTLALQNLLGLKYVSSIYPLFTLKIDPVLTRNRPPRQMPRSQFFPTLAILSDSFINCPSIHPSWDFRILPNQPSGWTFQDAILECYAVYHSRSFRGCHFRSLHHPAALDTPHTPHV
jgi:hypothetical protein